MARRKGWESLSRPYRERLARRGITKSQYEHGRPLSGARGHAATPEHGLRDARRNPVKYGDYIRKRSVPATTVPQNVIDAAHALNTARDAAFLNMHSRLQYYIKYNENTVRRNIYGDGSRSYPGMNLNEARWTSQADTEELRSQASNQYPFNPWFYH
jgi:hypothetical protein